MNIITDTTNLNGDGRYSEKRAKVVNAVNKLFENFTSLSIKDFDGVISSGLLPLSEVVGFDRAAIYSYKSVDGGMLLGQTYYWDKVKSGAIPLVDGLTVLPDDNPVVNDLLRHLFKDLCVFMDENNMTKAEREFMDTYGVKSVLLTPVIIDGKFWGAVCYQNHIDGSDFAEGCLDLLRTVSRICASAIRRNDNTVNSSKNYTALKRREKSLEALSQTAITFLSRRNRPFEEIMNEGIEVITKAADIDRISVLRKHNCDDGLHISQIYRWDKASGGTTAPNKKYGDVIFSDRAPIWEQNFADGMSMNGPVSKMPDMERKTLQEAGAVSVYVTPVFFGDKFWGLVLYEDRRTERYFDDDLAEMMHSAAFLFANVVVRIEMERDLSETNELLKLRLGQQELISEISKDFILSGEIDLLMEKSAEKLGRHLGASRVTVYSMDYEKKSTRLAYVWREKGMPQPQPFIGLFDFMMSNFPQHIKAGSATPIFTCNDIDQEPMFKEFVDVRILSFTSAVVYVEGRLWGIIGVEQCDYKRVWTEYEVSFIQTIATIIASVIIRSIYNNKLNHALERANMASQAKGDFLSNMSHEMRTPLNTITGMSSIGLNSTDTDRKNYALEKIEEASSHLLGVINNVLDMSKIEANKLELVYNDFSFEKALKRAVNAICFRCEQKYQTLSVSVDGKIPHMLVGDDQRLVQVIINLLGNAVKFTPEKGRITLSAYLSEEKGDLCTVTVEVSDTGIGITSEQQDRLFHSFEQAESGMSRKFGGTGLGLAISKSIVSMMDGDISVESEYGKGSTFKFYFKAKRSKADNYASLLDPSVNWDTVKILAVDDSADTLSYLSDIFKRYGLKCDIALNGDKALDKINESKGYDVYFVDYHMPGMDGIELTKRIKEYGVGKKSVVIMISATEWSEISQKAESAGINRFLTKPLFASDILDCMNSCLGANSSNTPKRRRGVRDNELKGVNILLAEDVEINREIFLISMEITGAKIDCAVNGREAVTMVAENPDKYDLVLMDVQMPEMDGFEATRQIRDSGSRIPIIAMTANVFKEDVEKCLESGMDDHLGKPLDMSKVMTKIRRHLNKR